MTKSSKYFEKRSAQNQWDSYNDTETHNKEIIKAYERITSNLVNALLEIEQEIERSGLSRSLVYRTKYLVSLKKHYTEELNKLGKVVNDTYSKIIDEISKKTYKDTSNELGFDIQYNDLSVKRLSQQPWRGATFKTRLGKNQAEMTKRLFEVIEHGITTGLTPVEMAIRVKNSIDKDFSKTMMLVRTETMHHLNQVKLQSYKDSGVVEKLKDIVTMDDRTSEQCAECAGSIYDIDKAPILPRHPRCRCVLVAYIDVDKLAKQFEKERISLEKGKNVEYNKSMQRRKNIDNNKMSVASKSLINKLSRKFRRRNGVIINDDAAITYLDSRNAEAITLDAYTILTREKISISALIEELEHSEQYLSNENDGTRLSVVKNEILAKEKSIKYADRYKIPKIEIEAVKKDIELYKEEYRRLTENESS